MESVDKYKMAQTLTDKEFKNFECIDGNEIDVIDCKNGLIMLDVIDHNRQTHSTAIFTAKFGDTIGKHLKSLAKKRGDLIYGEKGEK